MTEKMCWLPLESNPEVLNKYLIELGVKGAWKFHDVVGLEDEHVKAINGRVAAVLLLYPLSDAEKSKKLGEETQDKTVYMIKSTAKNSCGTVALLHALMNNGDMISPEAGSKLARFMTKTKTMTPEQRGTEMNEDKELHEMNEKIAREGQTKAPCCETDLQQHYVCFVNVKGNLYELDGRKSQPILHGKTSESTLLADALRVIGQFVARDANRVNFSVLALSSQTC